MRFGLPCSTEPSADMASKALLAPVARPAHITQENHASH